MPTLPNDSFLSGGNIEFIEALYARYLADPASVDSSWRELFQASESTGRPIFSDSQQPPAAAVELPRANGKPANGHAVHRPSSGEGYRGPDKKLQARVDQAIYAFRLRGHLLAELDPLGRPRPRLADSSDLAMVAPAAFTDAELEEAVDSSEVFPSRSVRLADLLGRLRRTYCGHIGVEFMTMLDSERRQWLRQRMEHQENRYDPSREQQRHILTKLSYAEAFEQVMYTKDKTKKRFSADGAETMVPMIDTFLEVCGDTGVEEVVIGMAHRGRLNVLANVLKKSPDQIFSEFFGPSDPKAYLGRGDVKYHMGFSSEHQTRAGKQIHLSLAFNPSHLEIVDPVVQGRVRAKQDRRGDTERSRIVPLLIHGDAAFSGQGVVAETLNLMSLPGYTVGGTVHIVINNQVGFTTDPEDGRSFRYCTGFAQMLDIPVFHVNGDDPEACCYVMRLATEYRQRFKSDVVLDVVCYRRFGHNEMDEPAFTQPDMYALIRARPKVRELYADKLAATGSLAVEEAEAIRKQSVDEFSESYERVKVANAYKAPSFLDGLWKNYRGGLERDSIDVPTAVPTERLRELLRRVTELPPGFTVLRQINDLMHRRQEMAEGKVAIDWAAAEHLAYASLLTEGVPVRLTGQDTERGTFSHRHAVIHDAQTAKRHVPLRHLDPKQAPLWLYNSPLSELGPLGFEFGFSLDYPDALVAWEAQFGDFANMAQAVIDQFISASEEKWKRLSGLVLLLPHGYEGQGPEHSSARLERFLDLCGGDNIQVVVPSTAAQVFHMLRRQVLRLYRKPLVVMTTKENLRNLKRFASPLEDLATGTFQRVIADPGKPEASAVDRVLLCSGKVYCDLAERRAAHPDPQAALVRVEQLYPFPRAEVEAILRSYPGLREVFWVQEEPKNMGAWRFVFPWLTELLAGWSASEPLLGCIGRPEAASPATGVEASHRLEQEMIVDEALSRGGGRAR